jgi:hypothetical protein
MTPFTALALMTHRAAVMFVAATSSYPAECDIDWVPHNSAVRLVIANTLL